MVGSRRNWCGLTSVCSQDIGWIFYAIKLFENTLGKKEQAKEGSDVVVLWFYQTRHLMMVVTVTNNAYYGTYVDLEGSSQRT